MIRNISANGFTLVEVLVALVVIAVGMLGIAGLYVESLRAGRTSILRTNAIMLAADMAERIRANPNAAADYAGTGPGSDAFDCVNGTDTCTAAELAADDWFRWWQDVTARLPQDASANIDVVSVGSLDQYSITLSWPETGTAERAEYELMLQL